MCVLLCVCISELEVFCVYTCVEEVSGLMDDIILSCYSKAFEELVV